MPNYVVGGRRRRYMMEAKPQALDVFIQVCVSRGLASLSGRLLWLICSVRACEWVFQRSAVLNVVEQIRWAGTLKWIFRMLYSRHGKTTGLTLLPEISLIIWTGIVKPPTRCQVDILWAVISTFARAGGLGEWIFSTGMLTVATRLLLSPTFGHH